MKCTRKYISNAEGLPDGYDHRRDRGGSAKIIPVGITHHQSRLRLKFALGIT
jgi:hypothetical protein